MRKVADILRKAGLLAALALAVPLAGGVSAHAQGLPAVKAGKPGDKLLVEADELIYDNDRSTVTARGNAELHYGPRTLQADRVRYDRNTGRVFAEGNVRLTEADGGVVTGERMELTDDFKTGFVDAFRGQQTVQRKFETVRTRFSAPRAERLNGEQTSFESGSYTACEPCKDNPETPPLWQIKAKKIIHDNETHTVYFDESTLELAGIPVAYLPYFEAPDPTVKRKTGFLTPRFI
ncbi:MAG: LPS-assembly protein LptD, partial [Hyphomicrobiales bacterium]